MVVVTIVWVATLTAVFFWYISGRETRLAIAAGPADSESFHQARAIAEVYNKQGHHVLLDVFETSGSAENARLMQEGRVAFATIQADTHVGNRVNAVALMHHNAFQLVVNEGSDIHGFGDLRGRRVAIAPASSGQGRTFWFVARHYGLDPDSVSALPMSESAANFAMVMGQVDAVFRVRVPGNESIRKLVRQGYVRLVPIDQAAALALELPAVSGGTIPAGAYRGEPPVPPQDLPAPVLEQILVARSDVNSELVHSLTQTLFEQHSDLVVVNPLAGLIRPLDADGNISMRVHPGAQRYYDREKPSFLQRNTRLIASLLYVIAILISAGLALRSHLKRKHRIRVGIFNEQLVEIMKQARSAHSVQDLDGLKDRLLEILEHLLQELDQQRVTQDEFEHFSFAWQAADTVVRDRLVLMSSGAIDGNGRGPGGGGA